MSTGGNGYSDFRFLCASSGSEPLMELIVERLDKSSIIGGESAFDLLFTSTAFPRPFDVGSRWIWSNDSEKWLEPASLGEEERSGFKEELSASDGASDSRSCKVEELPCSISSCEAAIEFARMVGVMFR